MSGGGRTIPFPERSVAEEEAARWVVRTSEGPLAPEDAAAFEAWRRASPRHADIYARMRAQWDELGDLGVLGGTRPAVRSARDGRRLGLIAAGAAAAGLMLAAGLSGTLIPSLLREQPDASIAASAPVDRGRFATLVGEQKELAIEDGSRVMLNTASLAEVRLTQRERRVRLIEGEAFFQVARDAERPFRVYTERGMIEAIGTAFSVRIVEDELRVVVEEGRVAFATGTERTSPVIHVSAGQSAVFGPRHKLIETLAEEAVEQKLSWLGGKVAYAGEPLSMVVQDISRYTDMQIDIADPDIESLRVGGYFEIGDVDGLLAALEEGFGLHIDHESANHVRISRASE